MKKIKSFLFKIKFTIYYLSDGFFVGAAAFVLFVREHLPVGEIAGVGLHDRCCFHTLDTILLEVRMLFGNDDRIDSHPLVIRAYTDEQQVEGFHLFRAQGT